jgi:carboxyl-terminal processing protease
MRSLHKPLRVFVTAVAFAAMAATAGAVPVPVPPLDDEVVASWQAAYARAVLPGEQADMHRELLAGLVKRIKRSHATDVDLPSLAAAAGKVLETIPPQSGDPADVFRRSVNAALRTLDPQSRYVDARTHANERSEASGSFGGIGIEVEPGARSLRILSVVADAPAARAGIQAGDVIVRVDGNAVDGVPVQDTLEKLRGQPGTNLALTVHRSSTGSDHTFALTRDTIRRQILRTAMEGDVLVLKLSSFTGPVSASIGNAINEAAARNPRGIVLDLRGNPGGLFREAIRVADAFLATGDIVSERSSNPDRNRTWSADADQLATGLPLVVLLDRGSASASELVADALQFHGRATVMGQQSYGKGSVQTTFWLGEGRGAVKLTTSLYHGPSGETVHRVGVTPDIEITKPASATAARTATERADIPVLTPRTLAKAKARIDPARCAPLKAGDAELSCALDYLSAGSIEAFAAKAAH